MQTVDSDLAAAIEAPRRTIAGRLMIDFDRDGTYADYSAVIESLTSNRSITSDAPDGTRIVQGTAAADGQFQLGGKTTGYPSLANEWNPFNQSGPLWAKKRIMSKCYADVGFDVANNPSNPTFKYCRMFTGRIRMETDTGSAGTVTFQPVDPSSLLKTPVLLPMMTQLGHPGLDSRTFIDIILTANGFDPDDQDLEDSLNPLVATPYTGTKDDAWTTIQAIAKAEMAVAFFDETGKFHFWNRNHFKFQTVDYSDMDNRTVTVNGVTSPIPKVRALRELKDFTIVGAADTVRNDVQVNFQPVTVQPSSTIWSASHIIGVHSRSHQIEWADLDSPAQSIDTTVNVIGLGGTTGGHSGYRACTNNTGTGDPVENLTITLTAVSAQRVKIDIYNPNRHPVYLVASSHAANGDVFPDGTAGQPFLWIRGRSVIADPQYTSQTSGATGAMQEVTDSASMDPDLGYGTQSYQYDGGPWLQDGPTALTLTQDILSMCNRPMPYLDNVTVVGDPRLQIGDRIELIDSVGMPLDEDVFIVGKSDTLSTAQGFAQVLTVKLCAGIGGWILGHPTRSILGSTTILGGVY